nr:hypothetical protein CFP56_54423 [Quercus suber]
MSSVLSWEMMVFAGRKQEVEADVEMVDFADESACVTDHGGCAENVSDERMAELIERWFGNSTCEAVENNSSTVPHQAVSGKKLR